MTSEVALNGTRHAVDARRDGGRWIVTLDGRELGVDIVEVGGESGGEVGRRSSLLVGPSVASGLSQTGIGPAARSYEIAIEPRDEGGQLVSVNGHGFLLTVEDPRAASVRDTRGSASGGGPDLAASAAVTAPMPGRVVKLLVKPGDVVAARQPLVVVEAMKMENELRAPRAGTVGSVQVSEGQSVEAHAVLVELT